MKNKIKYLICLMIVSTIVICTTLILKKEKTLRIDNYNIIYDTKFGGSYVDITIDDFNKLGFEFGDSLDVTYSNGYKLEDIPYYNGYYVDMDMPLVVGYPGYPHLKIGFNNGPDLWKEAKLKDDDTVSIVRREKGKYKDIQEASDIHYTDEQGDTPDYIFGNFRNVKTGKLKDNIFYRSASPVDNSHNRASVVDKLIQEAKINYIVNLSDDEEDLKEHIASSDFNSPYFLSLYKDNKVIALSMNMQFKGEEFSSKLAKGLKGMSNNPGPYLVHCVEGKDRTGFISIVIEGLMSSTYEEMVDDYMITYYNYYGITKEKDSEKYNIIKKRNIDTMLEYITGEKDLTKVDYEKSVEKYLSKIGLSNDEITNLKNNLSK